MKLLRRIFSRESAETDVLRLVVCAILFTHGAHRLYEGSAPGLGSILKDSGFPAGVVLAYLVCLAETGGTVLLAMRLLVLPVTLILLLILSTGILLFHRHHGFFVVGPGEGGWEYSALLITCLLVTAWENRATKFF